MPPSPEHGKCPVGKGVWAGHDIVVIAAANSWDEARMADHQFAAALSAHAPVLYVDPASSALGRARDDGLAAAWRREPIASVEDQVIRLSPEGLPGGSRPGIAWLNRALVARQIRSALRTTGGSVRVFVEANMLSPTMGRVPATTSVYWAQDDFVAMAPLVGVSPRLLALSVQQLSHRADVIVAANPTVAQSLAATGRTVHVIPFGCDVELFSGARAASPAHDVRLDSPIAFLMGTLNDRLDVGALLAVAASGTSLLMVGPRSPRFADPAFDDLLARENVQWVGECPFRELPRYLAHADVGLVPYTHSRFNEGSFPLKTLEYLAAGLPVVATDLPAIRWLDSSHVEVASTPSEFAAAVVRLTSSSRDRSATLARQQFATGHSWGHRAAEFAKVVGL